MDTDRLSRWLILGANLGVLAGIILLVYELNQNREMMRAQTRNEITQGELSVLSLTAENKDLAEIVVKANQGGEMTPVEKMMWQTRSESVIRLWQNVHYQGRKGMYEDEEFAKHIETMRLVLANNPGLMEHWCLVRGIYPSAFEVEVNALIPEDSCQK